MYVQNYFGNSSQKGIIVAVSGFFTLEEIVAAKCLLFNAQDELIDAGHVSGDFSKHRLIQRKADDVKKRELDTADIMALYTDLDKCKASLPVFTAANLKRIPQFVPDATDICSLTMNVATLQSQMDIMHKKIESLVKAAEVLPNGNGMSSVSESYLQRMVVDTLPVSSSSALADAGSLGLASNTSPMSWAVTAASSNDKWQTTSHHMQSKVQHQVKIRGSRGTSSPDDRVKAVPRKSILAAYVGRLHIETTEGDLTQYMIEFGVKGVVCKKLQAEDGRTFNTAAFYVTCSADSKNLFYNKSCWPEGSELRDWVYFHK
jgi:hypothetical protein